MVHINKAQLPSKHAKVSWRPIILIALCVGAVGMSLIQYSPLPSHSFLDMDTKQARSNSNHKKTTGVPPDSTLERKEVEQKVSLPQVNSKLTRGAVEGKHSMLQQSPNINSLAAKKIKAKESLTQARANFQRKSILQCQAFNQTEGTGFETHRPLQCSDLGTNILPVSFCNVTNKCVSGNMFPQLVHAQKDIVSNTVRKGGCWETPIVRSIVQHFGTQPHPDKHRVFVDVGGNVGVYTTVMANLGHPIVAVEPFRLNVPLILGTLCHLRNQDGESPVASNQVHLFKVALSDTSPGQKMCLKSTNNDINIGNGHLVPLDSVPTCMEVVQSYTLDELLLPKTNSDDNEITSAEENSGSATPSALIRPNHRVWGMKMDIEGFETRALRGATRLLAAPWTPCRIWFEYHRGATVSSGAGPFEIFHLLLKSGFTELYSMTQRGWESSELSMNRTKYPDVSDYMAVHGDAECHENDVVGSTTR